LENNLDISRTPNPQYYVVIFSSIHKDKVDNEYYDLNDKLMSQITDLPGFISVDSAIDECGKGITTVYFEDVESIKKWRNHPEHKIVKIKGKDIWYEKYIVRIAKVEKEYGKI